MLDIYRRLSLNHKTSQAQQQEPRRNHVFLPSRQLCRILGTPDRRPPGMVQHRPVFRIAMAEIGVRQSPTFIL